MDTELKMERIEQLRKYFTAWIFNAKINRISEEEYNEMRNDEINERDYDYYNNDDNDKLYGEYDDWEDYYDSIYN